MRFTERGRLRIVYYLYQVSWCPCVRPAGLYQLAGAHVDVLSRSAPRPGLVFVAMLLQGWRAGSEWTAPAPPSACAWRAPTTSPSPLRRQTWCPRSAAKHWQARSVGCGHAGCESRPLDRKHSSILTGALGALSEPSAGQHVHIFLCEIGYKFCEHDLCSPGDKNPCSLFLLAHHSLG